MSLPEEKSGSVHAPLSLRALVRASRAMALEPDPVKGVGILVSALREDLDIDRAGVFLLEHHTRTLDRVFGIDRAGRPEAGVESLKITEADTPLMDVARRVRPFYFSNNAPAMSMRAMVKEASAYYLLGYRSEKNPADGKFHKIAVNVKRSGVDVKARTRYYAPSAVEMDTARRKAAEAEAPPEISKALSTLVVNANTSAVAILLPAIGDDTGMSKPQQGRGPCR